MTIADRDSAFDEPFGAPKSEVSMLALVAFVTSILVCIPILPPLGVILGMVALVRLTGNPMVRGRGLAVAAIVLGLCFSIGLGVGGYVFYTRAVGLVNFVNEAPAKALESGFGGDIEAFRSAFSSTHPSADASAFIDELRARYGEFESLRPLGPPSGSTATAEQDRAVLPVRYRAEFSNGPVDLEVELLLGTSDGFTQQLESIRVIDRDRPALRFPPLPEPPTGESAREGSDTDGTVPEDGAPENGTPANGTPANGTPANGTPGDGTP